MPSRTAPALQQGFLIHDRYRVIRRLGGGAAGTVYLVQQLGLNIERALKQLSPKRAGLDSAGMQAFRDTFAQETHLLASITHRNIVKIVDAGTFETDDGHGNAAEYPFFVMEFVPQKEPFVTLLRSARSKNEVLGLILQILDGLEYLHYHHVLHADIKPDNLLCHEVRPGEIEVKIGDLGVAKALWVKASEDAHLPGLTDLALSTMTRVYGSLAYAPPYARNLIAEQTETPRQELRSCVPHMDIFCLGVTLTEAISTVPLSKQDRNLEAMLKSWRPEFAKSFNDPQCLDVLKRILRRMLAPSPSDRESYKSVAELRRDFDKLRDEYLQPLGLPELAVGGIRKSITLTGGKLLLSDRLHRLIDHPMVQRLRGYSQLNLLSYVFPEATHSRFTHSLNVLQTSLAYVKALLADPYFRHLMDSEAYTLLCAAALLHDCGHYPLAHAFDDLAERHRSHDDVPGQFPVLHKAMTSFVLEYARGWPSLTSLLEKAPWGVDTQALLRLIARGRPVSQTESMLQSILDGPIDADKVAYLTHDSRESGVPYGSGIDLQGFYAGLIAIPAKNKRPAQIGVSLKGIIPAESIIRARSDMYSRVYWHHTNRAMMAAIQHAAHYVFVAGTYTFRDFIYECLFLSDCEALRVLAREYRTVRIHRDGVENPVVPVEGLLDGRRDLYKRMLSISASDPREEDQATYRRLVRLPADRLEALRLKAVDIVQSNANESLCPVSSVLFDVPQIEPEADTLRGVLVHVPGNDPEFQNLGNVSDVVRALQKDAAARMKKCRLFVPSNVRESLQTSGCFGTAEKELRTMLDDETQ